MRSIQNILCSFLVVFVVFFISSTTSINEKRLEKICSKTKAKENCLTLLNSDYRTSYVSLKDLTEVAIDVTLKKLREARQRLDGYGNGISFYNYHEYSPRSQTLHDAINKLEATKEAWKSGNYNNIKENVKDVLEKIENYKTGSSYYSNDVENVINDAKLGLKIVKITFHHFTKSKKYKHKKHKHEDDDEDDDNTYDDTYRFVDEDSYDD